MLEINDRGKRLKEKSGEPIELAHQHFIMSVGRRYCSNMVLVYMSEVCLSLFIVNEILVLFS
jgi:hypothetical protein